MICGSCGNAKRNAGSMVYCLLFGIFIHAGHQGCKYHDGGDRDEDSREVQKPKS